MRRAPAAINQRRVLHSRAEKRVSLGQPRLGICLVEVHRRRTNREIDKRHIANVANAVQVAIRKPDQPRETPELVG